MAPPRQRSVYFAPPPAGRDVLKVPQKRDSFAWIRALHDVWGEYTCAALPRLLARLGDSSRTLERVRRLCLALPEARETEAWGHPVFKAGAKTFAAIEPVKGRPSIAFRLDPVDVDLLLKRAPFFVTPYGRGLWVSAWADTALDWPLVGSLVERSYRVVALRRMVQALDGGAAPARQVPPAGKRPRRPR